MRFLEQRVLVSLPLLPRLCGRKPRLCRPPAGRNQAAIRLPRGCSDTGLRVFGSIARSPNLARALDSRQLREAPAA
eukprot:COSAG03_NODE_21157_length_308_cov_0.736842_1_plen_75_part_01